MDCPPFRLLGPLTLGDPPGRAVQGQLGRALAVLLVHRGAPVAMTDLARWTHGETATEQNDRIHVIIARLRRLLRDEQLPAEITTVSAGYRLDAAAIDVDAARFAQLLASRGPEAGGRLKPLDSALDLWRGDVAEGLGLDADAA